jgi:hypothetical protein
MLQGYFFGQLAQWKSKFHAAPELPFSETLSADRIDQLLQSLGCSFLDRLYTPAVTLWMFLSQVLSPDPSCRNAVARFLAYRKARGLSRCSTETGSYCEARQRLPEALVERLARDTGHEICKQALDAWRWQGRLVKIVDGTTASMPDTQSNAKEFGKPTNQKGDCGFPIARIVMVICLATGAGLDGEIGPYRGKKSGELSLFRKLLKRFQTGDILLADRLFCTYCDIARLQHQGVDCVFRLNAHRKVDYLRGRWLGHEDHILTWHKPVQRPKWLTPAEFSALPPTMEVREVGVRVVVPGFRVRQLVVATTLLDPVRYTRADLAMLYRQRWHGEVDLRSIKCTLQMDVLRCKTPQMVRKEIWLHLLANNLLRSVMCATAVRYRVKARELSFRGTQQMLNALLTDLTTHPLDQMESLCQILFEAVAQHPVGHRPNRYEPRKRKRAAKPYAALKLNRAIERRHCLGTSSA